MPSPLLLTPTLAVITWQVYLLAGLFLLVSLFMMLVILIQKPKGGGLGGAFGGGAGGGSQQAVFGARVGDVLTWITVISFVCFLGLAMGLTWLINPGEERADPDAAVIPTTETTSNTEPAGGEDTLTGDTGGLDDNTLVLPPVNTDNAAPATQPDHAATGPDTITPPATQPGS